MTYITGDKAPLTLITSSKYILDFYNKIIKKEREFT